jgi:3-deoxy-D-manno-octulosonic-acid transferase
MQANAMQVVQDASALAATMDELINQPERRAQMGQSAKSVVEANRGALVKQLGVIEKVMSAAQTANP